MECPVYVVQPVGHPVHRRRRCFLYLFATCRVKIYHVAMSISAQINPTPAVSGSSKLHERNVSLDFLKLALACMVVSLHVGIFYDVSPVLGFLTGEGIFRIAVPIFLIINGYYFFPVLQRNGARGWFSRIGGLYLFWSAVYLFFWVPEIDPTVSGLIKAVRILAVGYYHLWYVAGMIGAGLLVLAFRRLPGYLVLAAALLLYVAGVGIQYAGNYHVFTNTQLDRFANITWIHRNFLFLSFPFFYIGYFISETQLHRKFTVLQMMCVSAAGLGLLVLEAYFNFGNYRNDGSVDNYMALLLVCPAIFIGIFNMKIHGSGGHVALYSSAIYFVHILVLYALRPFLDIGSTLMAIVVLLVSIIVASALVRLSRKFRFIL
ncbi:acyltransferase [Pseudoduganella dura]|nr:acyltransferase family protein [Pseudoduganella dura]